MPLKRLPPPRYDCSNRRRRAPYTRVDRVKSKSDEELLADHLSGVPGAFDRLVSRYVNDLYGFLCRFVGNGAAAEDLTQDAFVQIHLAASAFDPKRTFKPWLYTIAANKARDYLRTRGRRTEFSLDAGAEHGRAPRQNLESEEASLADVVEGDEQREQVRALVDQMPEHLRLILTLGYYQQLSYAEIAQILDIPVGTVKSRLHAAVQHFAKQWRSQTKTDSTTQP